MSSLFTFEEHSILLSALARERKVCEKLDEEPSPEGREKPSPLLPILDSIERKVYELQHNEVDLKKHYLVATLPEWDDKNKFWRCPSCKRRIHEYHTYCKHCGKQVDWMPLMQKRKKEAEIRGRKEKRKAART